MIKIADISGLYCNIGWYVYKKITPNPFFSVLSWLTPNYIKIIYRLYRGYLEQYICAIQALPQRRDCYAWLKVKISLWKWWKLFSFVPSLSQFFYLWRHLEGQRLGWWWKWIYWDINMDCWNQWMLLEIMYCRL